MPDMRFAASQNKAAARHRHPNAPSGSVRPEILQENSGISDVIYKIYALVGANPANMRRFTDFQFGTFNSLLR